MALKKKRKKAGKKAGKKAKTESAPKAKFHPIPEPDSKFLSEICAETPTTKRDTREPGDSVGDWLAKHLAKSGDTTALRKLIMQLDDPKQRGIVEKAAFETLEVVDRLAWLAENNIPASVLEKLEKTNGES